MFPQDWAPTPVETATKRTGEKNACGALHKVILWSQLFRFPSVFLFPVVGSGRYDLGSSNTTDQLARPGLPVWTRMLLQDVQKTKKLTFQAGVDNAHVSTVFWGLHHLTA